MMLHLRRAHLASTRVRVLLFLSALTLVCGRKKKSSDSGGGDASMFPCTEVYLGGRTTTAVGSRPEDDNYVAMDYLQVDDNFTIFNKLFSSYCTPIIEAGDGDGDGSRRLLGRAKNSWASLRRGGDDDEDEGDPPPPPGEMFALPDTCGDGDEDHPLCVSRSEEWKCSITNPAGFMAQLRNFKNFETDDCWTDGQAASAKCQGAPWGAQTCKGEAGAEWALLGATEYTTGMEIVISGDRCNACSLSADMGVCPQFYDVHSCTHTWTKSDPLPPIGATFTISVQVNTAGGAISSSLL